MDFSIEPMDFGDEPGAGSGLALKLATDDWEVNVYAPPDEFLRLCDTRAAAWTIDAALRLASRPVRVVSGLPSTTVRHS